MKNQRLLQAVMWSASMAAFGGAAFGGLAGCRGEPSDAAPVVPIRNMYDQPRYDPQQRSRFFRDQRTMRPLVAGTVAREMEASIPTATGRTADNTAWLPAVPEEYEQRAGGAEAFLKRGQERYEISCTPCHGSSGNGKGMVAQRASELGYGTLAPPDFRDERLRHIPDGQLFATISNGIRNMPPYAHSISVADRWAIVRYVRALQLARAPGQAVARPSDSTPAVASLQESTP